MVHVHIAQALIRLIYELTSFQIILWILILQILKYRQSFALWMNNYFRELMEYIWSLQIWAMSWENLFMPYVNNKGADQPFTA